jgi:starvation-inducible DNA-binding protein
MPATLAVPRAFPTKVDLGPSIRDKATVLLNQHLADTLDLFSQIKQAHWNVKGLQFMQLHELFDKLAEGVEDYVDLLAERITALGGVALGTARMSATASRLPEYPLDAVDGSAHVAALVERFAALGKTTRAAIDTASDFGDADTADIFTEVSRSLDKDLWFLEAHLTQ